MGLQTGGAPSPLGGSTPGRCDGRARSPLEWLPSRKKESRQAPVRLPGSGFLFTGFAFLFTGFLFTGFLFTGFLFTGFLFTNFRSERA
jgi:hypothetical protein